jgi:hypothetical protein
MSPGRPHPYLYAAFFGYIIFATLESITFGASSFGQSPPAFLAPLLNIPLWLSVVVDTIGVAILVVLVVLAVHDEHKRRSKERAGRHRRHFFAWGRRKSRGGVGGAILGLVLALLAIGLVLWGLNAMGITLQTLVNGIRGFLGLH